MARQNIRKIRKIRKSKKLKGGVDSSTDINCEIKERFKEIDEKIEEYKKLFVPKAEIYDNISKNVIKNLATLHSFTDNKIIRNSNITREIEKKARDKMENELKRFKDDINSLDTKKSFTQNLEQYSIKTLDEFIFSYEEYKKLFSKFQEKQYCEDKKRVKDEKKSTKNEIKQKLKEIDEKINGYKEEFVLVEDLDNINEIIGKKKLGKIHEVDEIYRENIKYINLSKIQLIGILEKNKLFNNEEKNKIKDKINEYIEDFERDIHEIKNNIFNEEQYNYYLINNGFNRETIKIVTGKMDEKKIGLILENINKDKGEKLRLSAPGSFLIGVDFKSINLSLANLSGANLSGANLSGANLSGANLVGAILEGANLSGANLSGANLNEAKLKDINFSRSNLTNTSFEKSTLKGNINFFEADLIGTNFEDMKFDRGELKTDLFTDKTYYEVELILNFSKAKLTNVKGFTYDKFSYSNEHNLFEKSIIKNLKIKDIKSDKNGVLEDEKFKVRNLENMFDKIKSHGFFNKIKITPRDGYIVINETKGGYRIRGKIHKSRKSSRVLRKSSKSHYVVHKIKSKSRK